MSLGLPSFSMIFSGKAVSAIERSARGIVAMILTDGTEGGKDLNIYKKVDEVDFQNWTEQNYKESRGSSCKHGLGGGLMKTRVIELSVNNRKEVIELPINPPSVEFTEKQLNQAITLLNIGEANLKGERGLKYTKLSSFFPSEKSPFYKNAKKKPDKYVAMLQEWKTTKAVVRVIISDMKINLAMLIDDFTYSMREGDGDIYYTISFSEYRTLNVPSVQITTKVRNNGLLSRPAPAAAGGSYTVVGGDTLWGISKQKYGNGSSYPKIYNANNGTIEASAKKHGKSSSDNGHWIYPGDVYTIPA